MFIDPLLLPSIDSRCHCCGSHLLKVHLIWAVEVSDDTTSSSQRNYHNINIPVGAEEDKEHNTSCTDIRAKVLGNIHASC